MLPVVSTSTRMFPAVRSALRTLFLSTALLGVGVQGVTAQTVDDGGDIASQQLNLPQDVTVFGKSDPNVRKATAI